MDRDMAGIEPRKGMTIVGSDGEEVGEIDVVEANYVIVRKGLFPQDYYIPVSDIVSRDDDGTLRLATPAQEALDRGLGNPMVGAEAVGRTTDSDDSAIHQTTTSTGDVGMEGTTDVSREDRASVEDEDLAENIPEPEPLHAEAGEPGVDPHEEPDRDDTHRTVSLSEEEATATTRPVERGVVRVEKKIIEERQTFEVPLVEDEVQVTRRRVDREISDGDAAFEERTIEIPLRGQGVEIEKTAHVVEEVEIDKTAHRQVRQVNETVRRETAHVETDGTEIVDEANARLDEDEKTPT